MPVTLGPNGYPLAVPRSAETARPAPAQQVTIRARFDNQFTTPDNRQLWALSDLMSVDAAANYMVRRTLRMRGRYAYHNNPFVMGCANRLAKFVVGSGPKLHLSTGNKVADRQVENEFNNKWAKRVKLGRKLRTMRAARFYNGEGFCLLRTNPKVMHPVKLDLFEVEADQVSSPLFGIFPSQYPDQWFDGVVLDPWGNPETYHVLRQHPGAFGAFLVLGYEFDPWPAAFVAHDYGRLRPAQQRGIPEVTPALDIFEEARRYRRSVLAAAETASDHAGVVKSDAPVEGGYEPNTGFGTQTDYIEIRRRQLAVMPPGWDISQLKAEQPVQGYDQYLLSLLMEAGQTLDMPLFIMTGDARLANMSSAYVATQSFTNSVRTDREDCESDTLEKTFAEWLKEARFVGLVPLDYPAEPDHSWRWDAVSTHADPGKVATAQNQRLKNGTTNPSIECASANVDYEEMCERAAADFGVKVEEYKAALFQSLFASRGTPPPASTAGGTGKDESDPAEADEDEDEVAAGATPNDIGGSEGDRPFGDGAIKAYSPDQERDERGRFSGGGGAAKESQEQISRIMRGEAGAQGRDLGNPGSQPREEAIRRAVLGFASGEHRELISEKRAALAKAVELDAKVSADAAKGIVSKAMVDEARAAFSTAADKENELANGRKLSAEEAHQAIAAASGARIAVSATRDLSDGNTSKESWPGGS